MALRILASVVLLFSILYMPFWVSLILAFLGMIYFTAFAEAAVLFFLSDLLYGVKEVRFFNMVFISFIISIIFLVALELFKKKLKFYSRK